MGVRLDVGEGVSRLLCVMTVNFFASYDSFLSITPGSGMLRRSRCGARTNVRKTLGKLCERLVSASLCKTGLSRATLSTVKRFCACPPSRPSKGGLSTALFFLYGKQSRRCKTTRDVFTSV